MRLLPVFAKYIINFKGFFRDFYAFICQTEINLSTVNNFEDNIIKYIYVYSEEELSLMLGTKIFICVSIDRQCIGCDDRHRQ